MLKTIEICSNYAFLFHIEKKTVRNWHAFYPILTHLLTSRISSLIGFSTLSVSFQKNMNSSRTLTENSQTFHKFQ